MASKQIVHGVINAERAKATEATFGKSGDAWRNAPSLAGFHQALKPDSSKPYGDHSVAYTDRYGTGVQRNAEYGKPERVEAKQKPEAAQKGATTGTYRVPVQNEVVQ